jgi:signal transduction histidine kinase
VLNLKLAAKLSISMVLLALLATLIVAVLSGIAARDLFDNYVDKNLSYRLELSAELLTGYYRDTNGWSDVQSVFDAQLTGRGMGGGNGRIAQGVRGTGHRMGPGMGAMMGSNAGDFLLMDSKGEIIAASDSAYIGKPVPDDTIKHRLPLTVNDAVVGTLVMLNNQRGEWESEFINSVNRATIWAAVVASVIALIFGIIISRHLSNPIAMLTLAAKRLAGRELGYRAAVTTGDEIGELASSFNNMAESLERNEKLRRNLLADTAHELRTPLAILRGNLESMQEGVITASPETIISMHDEVLRITSLVNDLQEISLAEAGELRLNRREVRVEELVERVAMLSSSDARQKNINFSVDIPVGLPTVDVDPDRLVQVLLNILGNALRYTKPGGMITLAARLTDGSVVFSIKDTGDGIGADELAHVFERFYRSDQSRSRSGGGAGLGLAIAKSLVEAHGGRIWAESKINEGSSFSFTVPAYQG